MTFLTYEKVLWLKKIWCWVFTVNISFKSTLSAKEGFKNVCLYCCCCVHPRLKLQDGFCSNFHKTYTVGQNKYKKKCFENLSTFFKSCTVYFWETRLSAPLFKGIIAKSGFKVQTTVLQRAFWHTSYGNQFRAWGWAVFEKKGNVYDPIYISNGKSASTASPI